MPRKKKNTEHGFGSAFHDALNTYLEKNQLPTAWGAKQEQRYAAALFVVRIAMEPSTAALPITFASSSTHRAEETAVLVHFATLFSSAPDDFLTLAAHVRKEPSTIIELVAKGLREIPDDWTSKGDKEIAALLERKLGKKFDTSVIGKARKLLNERDTRSREQARERYIKKLQEMPPFLREKWEEPDLGFPKPDF